MKSFANLVLGTGLLVTATAASANCWMECVLPNPISGGCGKSVKVCDVSDPGAAAASLGNDIKAAENNLVSSWHDAYGRVPEPIRYVLETYPIALACAVIPETQAYALAIGAIEGFVAASQSRHAAAAPILNGPATPDWKKQDIYNGEKFLLSLDIGSINTTDWNSPTAQPYHDRFAGPWAGYTACIDRAVAPADGEACYKTLQREAVTVLTQ